MSSSSDGPADPSAVDPRTETICYRCDRPIEDERWIRLATRPGPGADAYESVSRPCCPDCVAAIGLLEVVVDPRRTDSD